MPYFSGGAFPPPVLKFPKLHHTHSPPTQKTKTKSNQTKQKKFFYKLYIAMAMSFTHVEMISMQKMFYIYRQVQVSFLCMIELLSIAEDFVKQLALQIVDVTLLTVSPISFVSVLEELKERHSQETG